MEELEFLTELSNSRTCSPTVSDTCPATELCGRQPQTGPLGSRETPAMPIFEMLGTLKTEKNANRVFKK